MGKTNLIKRFTQGTFSPVFPKTMGIDFSVVYFEVDGKRVKVQVRAFFSHFFLGGTQHTPPTSLLLLPRLTETSYGILRAASALKA